MKVLVVHNYYQEKGGEYVAVTNQINLFKSNGIDSSLFTKESLEFKSQPIAEKIFAIPETIYSRKSYNEIKAIVEQEKPDVAHVHNVFPLLSPSVYLALKEAGIPIIQTIHNFRFLCPNGLFFTHGHSCELCKKGNTTHAVRQKCYKNSYLFSALYALSIGINRRNGIFQLIDRFVALTRFTKDKLIESGLAAPEKISVLGNFIPDPLPEVQNGNSDQRRVAFIGRLSEEKGILTLVKAMRYMPDVRLFIAGEGPAKVKIDQLRAEYELENIQMTGQLEGDKKWDLIRDVQAVIVPSECYETFSITTLEAMAAGRAVVASRIGSLPYLVDQNINGVLFDPGHSQQLAQSIRELVSDPQKCSLLGLNGRKKVENHFSETAHLEGLMEIYKFQLENR